MTIISTFSGLVIFSQERFEHQQCPDTRAVIPNPGLMLVDHLVQKALLEKSGFTVVELKGKPIPFMRGRGNFFEKSIVRLFAFIEKGIKKEFELIAIAQKR